jgi:ParB family chromosome partitioning protein
MAKMMRVSELEEDAELAGIFPIDGGTLEAITASMKNTGYDKAQPLVVWKGKKVIVDGHTRRAAALAAGIGEVPVVEKEFGSLEEAARYTYKRQAERRNLTPGEILRAATELSKKSGRDGRGRGSEILAKELGVSAATVQHARTVAARGDREIIEQVRQNKMTINKAYEITAGREKGSKREKAGAAVKPVIIKVKRSTVEAAAGNTELRQGFEGLLESLGKAVREGVLSAESYEELKRLTDLFTAGEYSSGGVGVDFHASGEEW